MSTKGGVGWCPNLSSLLGHRICGPAVLGGFVFLGWLWWHGAVRPSSGIRPKEGRATLRTVEKRSREHLCSFASKVIEVVAVPNIAHHGKAQQLLSPLDLCRLVRCKDNIEPSRIGFIRHDPMNRINVYSLIVHLQRQAEKHARDAAAINNVNLTAQLVFLHDGSDVFNREPRLSSDYLHFYGAAGFDSLPNNCAEGENDRPCDDSFRPCYEFVPPLRLVFAFLLIIGAALVCGYGAGWQRLACFPLAFASGCLLLAGHRYWCKGEGNNYSDLPHGAISVTHKYLTIYNYCNTVITMANVLNKDKQIPDLGALAKGSSIRSTERINGIHRDTIMRLGVRAAKGALRAGIVQEFKLGAEEN